MRYNAEAQQAINKAHSLCPQLGDYWQEMFTPVAVVIEVSDIGVTTLEKTVITQPGRWTWDIDARPCFYTRIEFAYRWTYGRIGDHSFRGNPDRELSNQCWCDVIPERHKWLLDHLKPIEPAL